MPDSPTTRRMPPAQGDWKQGFPRRLGVFLMGIAIGLMILGIFQRMKAASQRAQDAEQREAGGAAGPATPPPSPGD